MDLAPKKRKKKSQKGVSKPTFTYAAKILEKYGIDMSNIRGKAPLEKIIVMLYEEGSRSHEVQEDLVFRDSEIRAFMADRYAGYGAIVKDLQEYHIERAACWAHYHHYLADAYVSDHRMGQLITLSNVLFLLEQRNEGLSPEEIQTNRTRYSMPIVNKIVEKLKLIRNAGNEYGQLVHRAVDYLLDDEEAYRRYLWNPLIPTFG